MGELADQRCRGLKTTKNNKNAEYAENAKNAKNAKTTKLTKTEVYVWLTKAWSGPSRRL